MKAVTITACVMFCILTFWYYFSHRKEATEGERLALFGSCAILASIVVVLATGVAAVDEWLHLNLIPVLPGTATGRDMLCMRCWYVQDFRPELICSKCGGPCEDANAWTWIDDEPGKTE